MPTRLGLRGGLRGLLVVTRGFSPVHVGRQLSSSPSAESPASLSRGVEEFPMPPSSRLAACPMRPARVVIALLLLAVYGVPAHAAEIGCFKRLGFTEDGKPEEIISEDNARKLWPSGFRPIPGMCQEAFLHGKIVKGDYEKLEAFYRPNHNVLNVFDLASPGGDLLEAIKIGRFMRTFLMTALSAHMVDPMLVQKGLEPWHGLTCRGPECLCASACALIWFGAVDRVPGNRPTGPPSPFLRDLHGLKLCRPVPSGQA